VGYLIFSDRTILAALAQQKRTGVWPASNLDVARIQGTSTRWAATPVASSGERHAALALRLSVKGRVSLSPLLDELRS
jgi:hypothetical protein